MLQLTDRWIWDFWVADTGTEYHLFFLQAPRSLGDPDLRHRNARIGHAVSTDLSSWRLLPDALVPGSDGAWDDGATWTGSIIEHDGLWYLLYTGISGAEGGYVQRIGLATSSDLVTWTKHPDNPLIVADPRWYEQLDLDAWHDQAWRDPWVFRDPTGDGFHALITARAATGPADGRGVVGHARSRDLVEWQVLPPLTEPGEFGQLEVPQVAEVEGRPYLLFSTAGQHVSSARIARLGGPPQTGTYACVGSSPLGPFDLARDAAPVADSRFYSGRLVAARDGRPRLLAFLDQDRRGRFVGEISDPMEVVVDRAGRLAVAERAPVKERHSV